MNTQNIIFDFGNVLFDLDLGQLEQQFRRLMGPGFEPAMQQLQADRIFETYETGGMTTPEFVDALRFSVTPALPEAAVTAAWNAIFVELPGRRLEWLLRLRAHYRLFLLSNINDLHARWIDGYLLREHHLYDFETRFFDGVYYSHLIRLRKPNRDIYEYVLADAELEAGECVFFDDLPANVEAAGQLGIRSILHPVGQDIEAHVAALGLFPTATGTK